MITEKQRYPGTISPWGNMKLIKLNKYSVAALLFIAVAAVLVAISLLNRLTEFITAAFVLSGMICAMTGIFILAFSSGEPLDPRIVGLLPVQGSLNLCQAASDYGIYGNAHFLPARATGKGRVMQFNPSSPGASATESFPPNGLQGRLSLPACDPFIQEFRLKNSLVVPGREDDLSELIRETLSETLEFAPRVSALWHDNTVTLTLHNYRFISGCQYIAKESPGCCTRSPCPACSLCGAFIAEGTDKVVALNQCSVSPSRQDVTLVFSLLPLSP